MLKIAIAGCTGRMGRTLINSTLSNSNLRLVAGSERPGFDEQATKLALGLYDLHVTSDPHKLVELSDAVIDFTTPEATLAVAREAAKKGSILIVGTTGFTTEEQAELNSLASRARIVQAGNFSIGVNLLEQLVEQAARVLGDSYDVEIVEMHHRHKKDAPSGTALMLGRAAAKGRDVSLEEKKVTSRDGITGERKVGDIGFSVQRGGDVVGIHDVMFAGPGEVVVLKHQGFNRDIYASGALRAAQWAQNKQAGLYSMKDVLAG